MARFDYNCDTLWLKHLREGESDLFGEALLYLETASKHFGDTSELGQTDHAAVRDVADMHLYKRSVVIFWYCMRREDVRTNLAHKGNQMVLAKGEDLDVPHNDELVMVLVEDSTVDDVAQVLFVALCEEEQRFRVAIGCIEQAFAVGVFSDALQHGSHGTGQLGQPLLLLFGGCFLAFAGALACNASVCAHSEYSA